MAENTATFEMVSDDDRLLVELSKIRDRLVERAEEISIKLDANMNPGVAASLEGKEQSKALHLFVTQAKKLERELRKLENLAESFRVHIY